MSIERVAVVIPSRDRWPLLRTALAGVLAQQSVALECVVVDDGSTDETAERLQAVDDPRVRVVRNDAPRGVAATRNLGLEHVTAPWVAFLDDDDVWAPGHLAAMLEAVQASGVDRDRIGLAFSGHLVTDEAREVTAVSPAEPPERARAEIHGANLVGTPSRVLLNTSAVRAVGGFDPELSIVADWELWMRIAARYEFVRSPTLLVAYMHHDGNMHLDADGLLRELAAVESKHTRSPDGLGAVAFSQEFLAYVAWTYRTSGQRAAAARWYLRCFRAGGGAKDLGRAVGILLGEPFMRLFQRPGAAGVDPTHGAWLDHVRRAAAASEAPQPVAAAAS